MAKCKCGNRTRIVSNVVRSLDPKCCDVCATPICGEPSQLSLMAPLIYDEIGINLCTTFDLGVVLSTAYPTATNAAVEVIDATYTYGAGNVEIDAITARPNCYVITLSNITVTFAVRLYDASCRLLGTVYPTAVYLPSDTTAPTYDADTNPASVELELFAPYGLTYDTAVATPTPTINFVGFTTENNEMKQGINMYGLAKLLDINTEDSTITVGLTLVLQSLYYAGYRVDNAGRIDIPKGSILTPENTDCMRFVSGNLLDLEIKPLDLSCGSNPSQYKQECCNDNSCSTCSGGSFGRSSCSTGAVDDTVPVIPAPTP